MSYIDIIGITAAICTSTILVPQIVKGVQTKRMNDISVMALAVLIAGTALWSLYGALLQDHILTLGNIASFSFATATLVLRQYYSRQHIKTTTEFTVPAIGNESWLKIQDLILKEKP